jgi:hypothetical protein
MSIQHKAHDVFIQLELHWDLPMYMYMVWDGKLMEQQQKKYIFQEMKSFSA